VKKNITCTQYAWTCAPDYEEVEVGATYPDPDGRRSEQRDYRFITLITP
jgi:hypothetical protein